MYNKTLWKDRIVEKPNSYKDQNLNSYTFTEDTGIVYEVGTVVTAVLMNKIEDGIYELYKELYDINSGTITLTAQNNIASVTDGYNGIVDATIGGKTTVNGLGTLGKFGVDSNADGLADGWTGFSAGTFSLANGEQTFTPTAVVGRISITKTNTVGRAIFACAYVKTTDNSVIAYAIDSDSVKKVHSGSGTFEKIGSFGISGASATAINIATLLSSAFVPITVKQAFYVDVTDYPELVGLTNQQKLDWCLANLEYCDGMDSVINVEVESVGKNLFDGKLESGTYSSGDGVKVANANISRNISPIAIRPSVQYKLSSIVDSIFYWYDKNMNYIGYVQSDNSISPINASYLNFRTVQPITSVNSNIQLEEGTTATAYEPYKNSILSVSCTDPTKFALSKLPNGVENKLELAQGEWKANKNISGEYVLKSTDIIRMITSYANLDFALIKKPTDYIYSTTNSVVLGTKIIGSYAEKYTLTPDSIEFIGTTIVPFSSTEFTIGFAKGTTIAQAQTALAGTKILYQLATPVTIPFESLDQYGISCNGALASYNDYTSMNCESNMTPSVKLTYPRNLNLGLESIRASVNYLLESTDHGIELLGTKNLPNNYYVNASTGNDSNDGLTSTTAFKTIEKAVGVLPRVIKTENSNGVIINIAAGTYDEDVVIKHKIGEGIDFVGAGASTTNIKSFSAEGCLGRRIMVKNVNATTSTRHGISFIVCNNTQVITCKTTTSAAGYAGIFQTVCTGNIDTTEISNKDFAISVAGQSSVNVIGCTGTANGTRFNVEAGAKVGFTLCDALLATNVDRVVTGGMLVDGVLGVLTMQIPNNYYVSTTGSDTLNNGLASNTPFRTIKKALSMIPDTVRTATGAGVTINLADGDYSAEGELLIQNKHGENIRIMGNAGSPTAVKVDKIKTVSNRCLILVSNVEAKTTTSPAWYSYSDTLAIASGITAVGSAITQGGFVNYYGFMRIEGCTVSNRGSAIQSLYGGRTVAGNLTGTGNNYGYDASIGGIIHKYGTQVGASTLDSTQSGGLIVEDSYQVAKLNSVPLFSGGSDGGGEGGEIRLKKPVTSTLSQDVAIDLNGDSFRVFENGGAYRGININLALCAANSTVFHSDNYGKMYYVTGSFTLSAADNHKVFYIASAGNTNITVPSTLPTGFECTFINGPTITTTFVAGSGAVLLSNPDNTKKTLNGGYAMAWVRVSEAVSNIFLGGNLKV